MPAKPLTSGQRTNYVNVCRSGGSQRVIVWSGALSGGDVVVMLLNKEGNTAAKAMDCPTASVDLTALGVAHGTKVACRNLWTNSSCGTITAGSENLTQPVASHSAVVLRLSPVHSGDDEVQPAKQAGGKDARDDREELPPQQLLDGGFVATTQLFPATHSSARATVDSTAVKAVPSSIASSMRGGDAAHSGRTTATGPELAGKASAPIKWSWGNVTQNGPIAFESIPAVTASGLVLAAASYGSYGGSKVSILHALDVETGKLRWNSTDLNGTIWASPLVVKADAGTELVVVGSENGSVYAIDTTSGALRWRLQTGGPVFSSAVTSDPGLPSAPLYIGSWDGNLYKLSRGDGKVLSKLQFETEIRSTPALLATAGAAPEAEAGAAAGADSSAAAAGGDTLFFSLGVSHVCVASDSRGQLSVKWRINTTAFAYGSPSLSNDGKLALFPPSGDRMAYARHAESGEAAWSHEIGAGRSDVSTQGAVSADGATFYFLGEYNGGSGQLALYGYDVPSGTSRYASAWPAEQGRYACSDDSSPQPSGPWAQA